MKALVLNGVPRLVHDHPEPKRCPGEALLAVRLAGICDTDLQLARGYLAFVGVLGHELVGEVIEADDRSWIGQRVVADINAGCGACDDCRERDGHHCATRTVLGLAGRDGALAEKVVVPEGCLVAVPDGLSDERAVFAEPLAAALHVIDDIPVDNVDPVVVLGDGKLGLLITWALLAEGQRVITIGHHRDKLALAAAKGAAIELEAERTDGSLAARVVVEATGSPSGLARALDVARPRGVVLLKTTVAGALEVDLAPVVIKELRVIGSRCGDVARAIAVMSSGGVDPTPLISARYGLADAEAALARAGRADSLKVLVEP